MSKNAERIKELEDELRNTKYNKATQMAVGLLKAKIARLKEKEESRGSKKSRHEGYSIKKSGDASVALIGFPSVGKSTLLNKLTNAESEVAGYEFTTLKVVPGTLNYKNAKIQILDLPGLIEGASKGKGRGKEVISCLQNSDLLLIIVDALQPRQLNKIMKELNDANIRGNKKKPDVTIKKKVKGGLDIGSTVKLTKISKEVISTVLREFKITNAEIVLRENIDVDEFIDAVEGNKLYLDVVVVVNKIDLLDEDEIRELKRDIKADLFISAEKDEKFEDLKEIIFDKLNLIRIYCKEAGKKADLEEPMIIKKDSTLRDVCLKLHRDFINKFKFARIWGKSVKFEGQKILRLSHMVKDGDIVEVHVN